MHSDHFKNIYKRLILLALAIILSAGLKAQVEAYFNSGTFNTPQNQPFLETYLTIVGNSLAAKQINGQFQNSVNIIATLYKDSTIVKANKYNLMGPMFFDNKNAPSFIDNQRYFLPNGVYTLQLSLIDNYSPQTKPLVIKETIDLAFKPAELEGSSIELLESFKRSTSPNVVSKSGFDLIPYTVNYFPETTKELSFYFESYNADTLLGNTKPFLYYYYIETSNTLTKLSSYGSFKKQLASKVNPLLGKIDISTLITGNYNLVIEIRDANNTMHLQKKQFFQRLNKVITVIDPSTLSANREKQSIANYFGQCNNIDTLKMFVECLWPIANGIDKERIINQSVKRDPALMKQFVINFWERRAADTVSPLKLWANYYKNVQQVMALFKCGKQKGYYTERGRVYLQYGPPNQRSQQPNEQNAYPYEIWQYYRTTNAANGQFFSNRKFVFVSKNLGDDCYNLIHSDMPGELNNPRWQSDVSRNTNGSSNTDNAAPSGSQYNQFNEIFSNPR